MTNFIKPESIKAWLTTDGKVHLNPYDAEIHEAELSLLRLCEGIAYEDADADDVLRWLRSSQAAITELFIIIEHAKAQKQNFMEQAND